VNVLAVALADESQRFIKGYPPKGARAFLQPNIEVMRLAALLQSGDVLRYIDERVEPTEPLDGGLILVHVGFGQQSRAHEVHRRRTEGPAPVFFGPQVTSWGDATPDWCRPRVVGDITDVWPQLRADAESGRLQPLYRASGRPVYVAPRRVKVNPEMDSGRQVIQFVRGCFCPEPVKPLCTEHLYCGDAKLMRTPEEIIGEVITLPGKRIHLLDEDVAAFPDYYYDVFRRLWNYRRQWVVNASDRIFEYPRLIRLLAKAGTKVICLNETFLLGRVEQAVTDDQMIRRLYRRVKSLQAAKILVGARLVMPETPDKPVDYRQIAVVLRRIDLDFVEIRFLSRHGGLAPVAYRPMVTTGEPAWVKNQFYSIEAIADRLIRRPRRVGFFTTAVYLLPYSMAYRQSYLEGLPWP
jgi:hypothetical protein